MIEIVALIVLGIVVMEITKWGKGFLIYAVPSKLLLKSIERVAHSFPWKALAEWGVVLLVGPFLARDFVKDWRSYLLYAFAALFLVRDVFFIPFYLALGVMGLGVAMLGHYGFMIIHGYFAGEEPAPGVGLLIPGVQVGPFKIPLVEGIVALIVALFVHEGAHGCVALRNRVPISNAGILTLGLLPIGAFVEPSEAALANRGRKAKAEVFAAGPTANILTFMIITVLLLALSPLTYSILCLEGKGVKILEVPEKISVNGEEIPSMAHGILRPGDVVLEINGEKTRCGEEFMLVMFNYREENYNGDVNIIIERNGIIHNLTLPLYHGYLGIKGIETVYDSKFPEIYGFLVSVLQWTALINMLIGIVNALPLPFLDGGLLAEEFKTNKGRKKLFKAIFYFTLLFLLINVMPWFV